MLSLKDKRIILVIDFNSLENPSISELKELSNKIPCFFIVTNSKSVSFLKKTFKEETIIYLENEYKLDKIWFNAELHIKISKIVGVNPSEITYVSGNFNFLSEIQNFLCGTIFISKHIDLCYTDKLTDMYFENISSLTKLLVRTHYKISQKTPWRSPWIYLRGSRYFINFFKFTYKIEYGEITVISAGRYFTTYDYRSNIDIYSCAILVNKNIYGKYKDYFNRRFNCIYEYIISSIMKDTDIYGVCSVPPRPNQINRNKKILENISSKCGIINLDEKFSCNKFCEEQKNLSKNDRERNVKGAFKFNGDLSGKNVVLIDDVLTTGATVKECSRALKRAGANEIFVVVLALTQSCLENNKLRQITYRNCNNKNKLMESHGKSAFYPYHKCENNALDDFEEGIRKIIEIYDNCLVNTFGNIKD